MLIVSDETPSQVREKWPVVSWVNENFGGKLEAAQCRQ